MTTGTDDNDMSAQAELIRNRAENTRLRSELFSKLQEISFLQEDIDLNSAQILYLNSCLRTQTEESQYRYECLETHLRKVEDEWAEDREAAKECDRLRGALSAKIEDYNDLLHSIDRYEDAAKKGKASALQMQAELLSREEEYRRDNEELKSNIKETGRRNNERETKMQEEQEVLEREYQELDKRMSLLKAELQSRDAALSGNAEELQARESELSCARRDHESAVSTLQGEISLLKAELQSRDAALSGNAEELQARESELSCARRDHESAVSTLQGEISLLKAELQSRDAADADLVISVLHGELSSLKSELSARDFDLDNLQQMHLSCTSQLASCRDDLRNLRMEHDFEVDSLKKMMIEEKSILDAKIISYEAEIFALQSVTQSLKSEIETHDNNGPSDSTDPLFAGLVEVNHDIELAFELDNEEHSPENIHDSDLPQLEEYKSQLRDEILLEFSEKDAIFEDMKKDKDAEIERLSDELRVLTEQSLTKQRQLETELANSSKEIDYLNEETTVLRKKLKESQCQLADAVIDVKQRMLEIGQFRQQKDSHQTEKTQYVSTAASSGSHVMSSSENNNFDYENESLAQVTLSLSRH
jgi:chromosome segregation ATPase